MPIVSDVLPEDCLTNSEPNCKLVPVLFVDLDGTVRFSKSGEYIDGPDDVALYDGVAAQLWVYKDKGYKVVGVTNQGGIAFGYKTAQRTEAEVRKMFELLGVDMFDYVWICPSHPDGSVEPYSHKSLMRKPYYGMLVLTEFRMAEARMILDYDNSLMVGDRDEDRDLAQAAGIKFEWADDFFGRVKK